MKKVTMEDIIADPRYKGRHVIVIAGRVFTAETGKEATKVLAEVEKKYPREIPAITYIPKADTLILWL